MCNSSTLLTILVETIVIISEVNSDIHHLLLAYQIIHQLYDYIIIIEYQPEQK